MTGWEQWYEKLSEIKHLNLPIEDFYIHLQKEVNELRAGRNNEEMIDVINVLGMLYVVGNYDVTLRDCYLKLKKRAVKYEKEKQKP